MMLKPSLRRQPNNISRRESDKAEDDIYEADSKYLARQNSRVSVPNGKSSMQKRISKQSMQEQISERSMQEQTSKPSMQERTSKPSMQERTSQPSMQERTSKPSMQERTSKPRIQHPTSKLSIQQQPQHDSTFGALSIGFPSRSFQRASGTRSQSTSIGKSQQSILINNTNNNNSGGNSSNSIKNWDTYASNSKNIVPRQENLNFDKNVACECFLHSDEENVRAFNWYSMTSFMRKDSNSHFLGQFHQS